MSRQNKSKEDLSRENNELNEKNSRLEKTLSDFCEQLSFYQIILETLPNPAFYKDTKGRFIWCNKAFEEYHGVSGRDLYGRNLIELKQDYYEPESGRQADAELISHPGEMIYEVVVKLPDGRTRTLLNRKATLKKEDGSPAGIVGIQIDITERKELEEDLRQREAKLKSIFRAAPTGIGVVSNRVLLDVNERICEMTGYTKEELVGQNARILYPTDEDFEYVGTEKYRQIAEKGTGTVETLWQCKDGRIINILLSSTPIDPANLASGVTFTALDITERKRAEEALRKSEADYRSVIENIQDMFYRSDANGNLAMASPSFVTFLGYNSLSECLNKPIADTFYYNPDKRMEFLKNLKEHKSLRSYDVILKKKDGTPVTVETSSHMYFNDKGEFAGVEGVFRDVTERKLMEESIRDGEKKFRAIFENANDAIFIANDTVFLDCNAKALSLFNCSKEDIIGRSPVEFSPGIQPDGLLSLNKAAEKIKLALNGEPQIFEWRHLTKDGTPIDTEISLARFEFSGNNFIHAIIRDTSERIRMENALRVSERSYRDVFNATTDALFVHEVPSGRLLDVNDAMLRMYGFTSKEEALAAGPEFMCAGIYPYTPEVALEKLRFTAEQGPQIFEWMVRHKSGELFWVEVSMLSTAVAGNDRILASVRNITKHKQEEEALQSSERKMKAIVDGSPIPQFVIDKEHRIIQWNKALEEYSGLKAADLTGTNQQWRAFYRKERPCMADLVVDGASDLISEWYAGRYSSSTLIENAYEATDFFPDMRGGTWLYFTAAPIYGEDGSIAGAVETLVDVTEVKSAEEALRKSDLNFRTLFENAPFGMIKIIQDGTVNYTNRKFGEILGYELKDIPDGRTWLRKLYPDADYRHKVITIWKEDLGSNGIEGRINRVFAATCKDGAVKIINFIPVMLTTGDVLLSFEDITERQQTEEALLLNSRRTQVLLQLGQMRDADIKEITDFTLEHAVQLTRSKIGYLAFLNEDESVLAMHSWSKTAMVECAIAEKPIEYPVVNTGLWGEAVRQRKPIITNDYSSENSWKKGYPAGHVQVLRHMNVPIFDRDRIVIVAGVGNKKEEYDDKDVQQLTLLMQGMWRLIDHKRALEALKQSELFLKESHRIAKLGGWKANPDTDYLEWTEGVYEIIGASPDYKPCLSEGLKFFLPKYIPVITQKVTDCLVTGEQFTLECESVTTTGEHLWTEVRGLSPVIDGERSYVIGTFQDITDRKLAEEALRESEEKYRSLFENAVEGFFQTTADGRFLSANPFLAKLLGFSSPQELIETLTNIGEQHYANPQDRVTFKNILESKGIISQYETMLLKKDGTVIWASINARAVRDEKGAILYYEGTLGDITERKMAEKALLESEQRYSDLYERLRDGSATVDNSGRIVDCNRRFSEMLGYTLDELKRLSYEDITPAKWHAMELKILKEQVDGRGYSDIYEKEYVRKDGRIFPVEIQTYLITGEQSGSLRYWAFVRDISGRKLAEQEKDALQAKLIQAQKMESVGRLAGGVAHDFNNMLNVILGYTELAMEELEPDKLLYNYLEEIRKSAQRSTDLTRQLLAFARKQTIAPKVLDLNETIDGMLKILRRLIGEDINLVWMPCAALWRVKIDPSQVDQLLANLCVNARDAIAGVGKVTIETENIVFDEDYCAVHTGFVPGDYVMLTVSDDGTGMDKEVLVHLFEPFFTTKDFGKGTGLGLATVYGIVKQNNGFINVYSEAGKGSSFKIYVPRYYGDDKKQKDDTLPETPKGRGELVLVVEDDAAMLKVSLMMLDTLGYKVLTAGTPGEALRLARENATELEILITDVVMPDMNGKELAKLVDKIKPGLKCLFASGYTANVIAHHGVLDEGVNFIQKPYSMQDLASKVREILDFEKK